MRLVAALLVFVLPQAALAFEPTPTHPGLTARAVLGSRIHRFLVNDCGWHKGLFEPLRLEASETTRRTISRLTRDMRRLDPTGGYRPDKDGQLRAVGWCLAGSVLAQRPASLNRHHFYCPGLRTGLDDSAPIIGTFLALFSMFEGGDTVRAFFTGTGFDLTGKPAPDWVSSDDNDYSLRVFYDALTRSITSALPEQRRHHLALALLAMGSILHVLQDMASPTHVRNDFRAGHLQRLGQSSFNRGSAFERYVSQRYGQFGLPRYSGKPVSHQRLRDFFTNKSWTGLADVSSVHHFSPGTLPPSLLVLPGSDAGEIRQRLNARLKRAKPTLGPIDLRCARRRARCHVRGPHGPQLAYRIDKERRLRFQLDQPCHAAAARHLLPLAVGYSTGMVNHLLRGQISLTRKVEQLTLTNKGAPIQWGTAQILAEGKKGGRRRLRDLQLTLPAKKGARLGQVTLTPPADTAALIVVVRGKGPEGDPLLAAARIALD